MMDNYIQLNKDDRLKLEIVTDKGEKTGEYLIFDLEDIELPLKYQQLLEDEKKNKQWLRNQQIIIEKRQDVKGKKLMSKNEEDLMRVLNDFYKKEEEIYDMFLGKGGVKKLLNGRPMGWTRFKEINDLIDKYIMPKLDVKKNDIRDKIKSIYGTNVEVDAEEELKEDE